MSALILLPLLMIGCVGYIVIPIAYIGFCAWIAWRERTINVPAKTIGYAVIVIGAWWLALIYGPRLFDFFSIFIATLIPNVFVCVVMLVYMTNPGQYRSTVLHSGLAYLLALGVLYLLPAKIADQDFPVLRETVRDDIIPGIYVMQRDTAADMVRQGYKDKSATITLYSDKTFVISRIPDQWIEGSSVPEGYDTFSGTWNVQKTDNNDSLFLTITKLDPGSAWGPSNIWYDEFKREGTYSFTINLTRERGQADAYALALPIMQMDDQGSLVFVRR